MSFDICDTEERDPALRRRIKMASDGGLIVGFLFGALVLMCTVFVAMKASGMHVDHAPTEKAAK